MKVPVLLDSFMSKHNVYKRLSVYFYVSLEETVNSKLVSVQQENSARRLWGSETFYLRLAEEVGQDMGS